MIIGTAGHIDHGKTALVKALTGIDTDRLPEEKRRGITVELGFAPVDLGNGLAASIIDVPGHEAFVKTMVAGAAGIDAGLLVVAADEGWMPQTREHLAILDLLEIPTLVVAVTKSDLVDAEEWLPLVREEIGGQLAASRWRTPAIVACSSVTGDGIAEVRAALAAAAPGDSRSSDDIFRLPVDRCFTIKGTGTVVTGTVWSGSLTAESTVRILPAGLTARVRRLQHHGEQVAVVTPGHRAAVALAGVDVADVPRGSALVTDESWAPTASLDAWVTLLDQQAQCIHVRSELRFHLAGADVGASLIVPQGDAGFGGGALARLKLDSPIAARGGDHFILRLPSPVGTVGGGVVLDPYPGTRSLTESKRRFPAGSDKNPRARLEALLLSAADGVIIDQLPVRVGISPREVDALLTDLECAISAGRAHPPGSLESAKERILTAVAAAETTFPLEEGVQFESAIGAAGCQRELARLAVAELVKSGGLVAESSLVRRPGWRPVFTDEHRRRIETLAHAICFGRNEPPSTDQLTENFGGDVPVLLRYLEREGRVVQVGADRFYAREAVAALLEKLRTDLKPGEQYGPSQLREILGFSRKYLIPFLEYCDRSGVTERKGDNRTLRRTEEFLDTDVVDS